jgi:hypothetical protein
LSRKGGILGGKLVCKIPEKIKKRELRKEGPFNIYHPRKGR